MTAPDPQLADSIGNGLVLTIAVAINVWTRVRGNRKLATSIDGSLHARMAVFEASLITTQDLVSIHTDKIKESNALGNELKEGMEGHRKEMSAHRSEMAEHRKEMHGFKETVEKGETLVTQINDYLERAKAGKLKAEPIIGSGGLTAIKEEKKKS